MRAPFYMLWCN